MSDKDNHPAAEDTAVSVYPIIFFKDRPGEVAPGVTDFRPHSRPAESEDEVGPKDESAPEPASSVTSPVTSEISIPVTTSPAVPAPTPAVKGPGSSTSPRTPKAPSVAKTNPGA